MSITYWSWITWLLFVSVVACSPAAEPGAGDVARNDHDLETGVLTLPVIMSAAERDRPARLVATTGIIGDVASTIAGEDAEVVVLMAPNQDPHGYQVTAGDLQLVADADAVLVNGWDLEEGLVADLENAAGDVAVVPVSAGIEPRYFDERAAGNEAHRVDPHVWLSPKNVVQWVGNIQFVLSSLDPANSESYAGRADEYKAQLRDLETYYKQQLEQVASTRRVLVTNHDAFGHFADAYGFSVVGTIIPGASSLAEPASRDMAALVERMREASVCAIFTENSASQRLAARLADELDHCDDVQIVMLYSGALGGEGSGAETYLKMMKANIDLIVDALKSGSGEADAG